MRNGFQIGHKSSSLGRRLVCRLVEKRKNVEFGLAENSNQDILLFNPMARIIIMYDRSNNRNTIMLEYFDAQNVFCTKYSSLFGLRAVK